MPEAYENIKKLLAPIPGKTPEGKDIKYEEIYDKIKESSREDLDLPQGVWVQNLKSADWKATEKMCVDVLTKQSKDLQVAAWLIEAWISLYNIKGLRAGFDFFYKFTEKFWDTAFPKFDLKDLEFRAAPYNWINEKLAERFNKIEVTAPQNQDLKCYSYATYIDIHKDGGIRITKEEEGAEKQRNPEQFQKSIESTTDEFYKMLKDEGAEALVLLKKLQAFLDGKFSVDGPSLYNAQQKVEEIVSFSERVLAKRTPADSADSKEEVSLVSDITPNSALTEDTEGSSNQATEDVHVDSVMNSRSEAYAVIEKAAAYLEKLDPHSPSPHLIKRAIKWGNLSLKELLNEMVKDPSTLGELRHLLGLSSTNEADISEDNNGGDDATNSPKENP